MLKILDRTSVNCKCIVPVKFQDTLLTADLCVVDNSSYGILGMDILAQLNANNDMKNDKVTMNSHGTWPIHPMPSEKSQRLSCKPKTVARQVAKRACYKLKPTCTFSHNAIATEVANKIAPRNSSFRARFYFL